MQKDTDQSRRYLSNEAQKKLREACDQQHSGDVTATADQHGGKVTVNGQTVYDSRSTTDRSK